MTLPWETSAISAARVMEAIDRPDAEAKQYTAVANQLGEQIKSGPKTK